MTDRREESAPRSVGAVRDEQAADHQRREAGLGTSWTSVILGWLAALGASVILSGIVVAIVGTIFAALGIGGVATSGGISGLVGVPLTLLIAFSSEATSREGWRAAPVSSTGSWCLCWP